MSDLKKDGKLRWSPSYLRNQGQMTKGQRRAYRELFSKYGMKYEYGEMLDLGGKLVALEIGFGMGENLLARALAKPDERFLGIEVHKPGIANLLSRIEGNGVKNLRVMRGDARMILSDYLEGRPLSRVDVLFPDPWPKPGDEHRRLVQAGFVDLVGERLVSGGTFQVATDVTAYGEWVEKVMDQCDGWEAVPIDPRPLVSRYEGKGLDEGREVWEKAWGRIEC